MKEYRTIKTVCFTMLVILVAIGIYSDLKLIATSVTPTADASKRDTMVVIERKGLSDNKVVYDRDTKVLYYYVYKGGLFPLYNADGSLKLYDGE